MWVLVFVLVRALVWALMCVPVFVLVCVSVNACARACVCASVRDSVDSYGGACVCARVGACLGVRHDSLIKVPLRQPNRRVHAWHPGKPAADEVADQ